MFRALNILAPALSATSFHGRADRWYRLAMATIRLPPRDLIRPGTPVLVPRRPDVVQPARPARPGVVVNTTALDRADAILAELAELKDQMAAMVHRVGTLLAQLDDPEILAAKGVTRWEELLATPGLPARPTAIKYVAIARHFSEAQARELGVEKGYAIVRYARDVLRERKPPAQLLRDNPRVAGTPLLAHTSATLAAVLRAHLDAQRARVEADSDTVAETDAAVRKLGPKLRKAGAPTATLRRVGRGDRCRVRVDLDPDEAVALARYLADAERARKRGTGRT